MGSNSCVLTNRVLLLCQVGKLSTADAVVTTVVVGRLGRLLNGRIVAVRIMMA